ncbi:hypothetical protein RDI58_012733 [Solanum bulbocastanum]|uniref:Defensin-like protein n=1 Tax=Solanum bulbocastanum TaxID=147425 RepID=A0AAN8YDC1_SOLBU
MAATKRSVLLIGLFYLALLIVISGTEAIKKAINLGRCSNFPDCNAACIQANYKSGGCLFVEGVNTCFCEPNFN